MWWVADSSHMRSEAPLPTDVPEVPTTDPALHLAPAPTYEWVDSRTIRGVLRTALLNRIERFGQREVRQRSAQEIAFVLMAISIAALVTVPALVPLVVALRGGTL